ncbi:MAG: asparagine synthase (glutamine-hydrolyzing) [Bacteroidota bacterium]|nr:asparagine synthase (glutamine-hydrolyzing) [Bacteroidota bacterium]
MCGISGIIGADAPDRLRIMTQMLAHRGPDDGAVWTMPGAGLGHRRLSILDLSEAGRQPMASEDGRFVLVFNGEIFNYTELRDQLKGQGHVFRSRSDSEVLLRACVEWGDAVVDRLVGQFAFAFWDAEQRRLLLARDHLGIKPLYLAEHEGALYFASEAKAIAAVLPHTRALREDLLPQYLAFLWVPGEETLFRGIRKMLPGSIAVYEDASLRSRRYWDPVEKWTAAGSARPSPAERDEEFRMLLRRAVRSQLMSDVPLGLLLSGGIDSTILLAEMAAEQESPRAFTAHYSSESRARDVFEDDLPYARLAATEFHAELEVATLEDDTPALLTDAVWHCDEPLADPTIVTNLALTRRARQRLTVLLSGMGADELLAGYPRYPAVLFGEKLRGVPSFLISAGSAFLRAAVHSGLLPIEKGRRPLYLLNHLGRPFVQRFIGYSSYNSPADLRALLADDARGLVDEAQLYAFHDQLFARTEGMTPLSRMLSCDLSGFLPYLNLENMDKTSMANSVEMRVPFLDHRLVEYSMALPDEDKLREGTQRKVLLRRAWEHRIPDRILRRSKTGYSPPVRGWLRNGLRSFIEDHLRSAAAHRGLFDSARIDRLLRENTAGREDHSLRLWQLLVLELWMRAYVDGTLRPPALDSAALPDLGPGGDA